MKTKVIEVDPQYPDIEDIIFCAKIIRNGGLVVFPTETVYGIAADFNNPEAMKRLRTVKKRSDSKPFSVLISQKGLISNYTSMRDTALYKLIDKFWPGPLTVVVPARDEGETIGVRMPDNLIALKLAEESQCSMAAPSANFEGSPPPSTCQDALKELEGLVDIAIDGGDARIGQGSTVVSLVGNKIEVLRQGIITDKQIQKAAATKTILFICTGNSCRSVMAEYLLKDVLRGRDDIEVLSAGTGVFIQSTASSETLAVLREQGISASGHVSQSINSTLLKKADLIFVMTRGHRTQVLERAPSVEKKVYLLKEFANIPPSFQSDMDIPDPIGQSHHQYQECLRIIKDALQKIAELV